MIAPPFPGYPSYLDAAAAAIGRPEAAAPARRITTLAALASLCAQADSADAAHVAGILAKAEEFSDQLHAAWHAAELMLADLRARRGLDAPPNTAALVAAPLSPAPATRSRPARTRKEQEQP